MVSITPFFTPSHLPTRCILQEMWSGERAWSGLPAAQVLNLVSSGRGRLQLVSDAHAGLRALVERCLDPDCTHRPSFVEICAELGHLLRREHAVAGPDGGYGLALATPASDLSASAPAASTAGSSTEALPPPRQVASVAPPPRPTAPHFTSPWAATAAELIPESALQSAAAPAMPEQRL